MLDNPFLTNLSTLTQAMTSHEWSEADVQYLIESMFDLFHDWDDLAVEQVRDAAIDWSDAREAVVWARNNLPSVPSHDVDAVVLMFACLSGQFNAITDMDQSLDLRSIHDHSTTLLFV